MEYLIRQAALARKRKLENDDDSFSLDGDYVMSDDSNDEGVEV